MDATTQSQIHLIFNALAEQALKDAKSENAVDTLSEIIECSEIVFSELPLEEAYKKLLNVHLIICPSVPVEKVDAAIATETKSNHLQVKYSYLLETLSKQTDLLKANGEAISSELISVKAVDEVFSKALDDIRKHGSQILGRVDTMMAKSNFDRAVREAQSNGVLMKSTLTPQ